MWIPVFVWSQTASRSEIINVAKRHLPLYARESMEVSGIIDTLVIVKNKGLDSFTTSDGRKYVLAD